MTDDWYSASLDMVVLVDGVGLTGRWLSIVLVRASSPARAVQAAIDSGKSKETVYENRYGQRVRWALERVRTVDQLGGLVSGIEVYAKADSDVEAASLSFGSVLNPSGFRVGESGVGWTPDEAQDSPSDS